MGRRADVMASTAVADHDPGQDVVGGVGAPRGPFLAPLDEDGLRAGEDVVGDERGVRRGMGVAAEEDLTDVGTIAKDAEDPIGGPQPPLARAMTLTVEPVGDGG